MSFSIHPLARPECRLPIVNNNVLFLPELRRIAAVNISDEGRDTRLFLVNVDTLESEFISVPDSQRGAYGFVRGADGKLYAGFFGGKIYRFDPVEKRFEFIADPFAGRAHRPLTWGGLASRRGRIYMGVYPTGEFVEYDIASKEWRVIASQPGEPFGIYANQFADLPDGRILVMLYGAHPEILIYQPATGQIEFRREVTDRTFQSKMRSLCRLDDERVIYFADHSIKTFNFIRGDWEEDYLAETPEPLTWLKFQGGRLFASGGRAYEVSRDGCREIETGLHSGNRVTGEIHEIAPGTFVCMGDNGLVARFSLESGPLQTAQVPNTTTTGMNICSLRKIPGRPLAVGGHFISSQIFSVNTETGATRSSLNKVGPGGGQITCVTELGGVVYLGEYGGAKILAWRPEEPFGFEQNPRLLCKIGHGQNRPMGLFNDGRRLYTATRADYGELGGAISSINPADGSCEVYRDFVPTQNPVSFFQHGSLFAGTTEIYGDQGSCAATAENAVVFTWSAEKRATLHTATPWPAKSLRALGISPGGRLIGFGQGRYFLFNVCTGECVVHESALPEPSWTSSGLFLDETRFLLALVEPEGKTTLRMLNLETQAVTTLGQTEPLRLFERLDSGEILATLDGAAIVLLRLHD